MKARVVLSAQNSTWVLGKLAERLVTELRRNGVDATLGADPDDSADVNHWMSYAFVPRRAGRVSTVTITHIDDPYKTRLLADLLTTRVDLGLCVSREMMQSLAAAGIPAERLWYVLPALDSPPDPSRIRIAIATRLYDDGRKREALLLRLAREHDLSPFHFEIVGSGWDAVVPKLQAAGSSVHWNPGTTDYQHDYALTLDALRSCEYYLYPGMDEGSLGTLDALALGLKTIVTSQGFHLDIPNGITEPFVTYDDLRVIFERLASARAERMASVRRWTWSQFAEDHRLVWQALLDGKQSELSEALDGQGRYDASAMPSTPAPNRLTWSGYYSRLLSPRRLLGAIGRARVFLPLRRALKR